MAANDPEKYQRLHEALEEYARRMKKERLSPMGQEFTKPEKLGVEAGGRVLARLLERAGVDPGKLSPYYCEKGVKTPEDFVGKIVVFFSDEDMGIAGYHLPAHIDAVRVFAKQYDRIASNLNMLRAFFVAGGAAHERRHNFRVNVLDGSRLLGILERKNGGPLNQQDVQECLLQAGSSIRMEWDGKFRWWAMGLQEGAATIQAEAAVKYGAEGKNLCPREQYAEQRETILAARRNGMSPRFLPEAVTPLYVFGSEDKIHAEVRSGAVQCIPGSEGTLIPGYTNEVLLWRLVEFSVNRKFAAEKKDPDYFGNLHVRADAALEPLLPVLQQVFGDQLGRQIMAAEAGEESAAAVAAIEAKLIKEEGINPDDIYQELWKRWEEASDPGGDARPETAAP